MKGTIKTLTDRGLKGVTFDELKQGDAVTFDVVNGEKGPSATNVSRA